MNTEELYAEATELYKAKKFTAALKALDELKAENPDYKRAYTLEACIREDMSNYVREIDALNAFLKRADLNVPEERGLAAVALSGLGMAYRQLAMPQTAIKYFCEAARLIGNNAAACERISAALLTGCHEEEFTPAEFQSLCAEYRKYLADIKPYERRVYNHERIRIGFLSADFKLHPAMLWASALLTGLDKAAFKVCGYSGVKVYDRVTNYLKREMEVWRDIADLNDAQAAQIIRNDEIDILFDLSGHTAGNRLRVAAYRPASVQISGIGYMNSTGLDAIDYFLTDKYCAGDADYFTERLIVLPHSHVCFIAPTKLEPAPPPCLKNGYVTFGSFNQFGKVTDSMLRTWKAILDEVPDSRLILKHKIFTTTDGRDFVSRRLKNCGVEVSRVEMRPYSANYPAEYADVDISLDTFPYTGGVTTCEALYMGVPVVSLYGDRHGTRFGLSILTNVGLKELAVDSYDDYVKRAVMLAKDRELLTLLRKNLRGRMEKSPLMDAQGYVRAVAAAFIKIWRRSIHD